MPTILVVDDMSIFREPLARVGHPFPRTASLLSIAIGCFVLAGWAAGATTMISVFPGMVPMNPATAVCLVLAGISLRLLCDRDAPPRVRRLARACAGCVAVVGILCLARHFGFVDLGLDRVLFRARITAVAFGSNRMAPNTAMSCLLIGGALLLLDVRIGGGWWPAQALAAGLALMTLVAITGYADHTFSFSPSRAPIPMALHTAVGFLLLAAGALLARPQDGWVAVVTTSRSGGAAARRLLPFAVGGPLLLGWLRLVGQSAGLFDQELGIALLSVSNIAVLAIVVWWTARWLNRTDEERERAEQKVGQLNQAIERRVLELDQANSALLARAEERRGAEESAAADSEAKSRFLASMSHEIRTPLNGVIGMTDLLLGTELTSHQRRYAQLIKSSGESLTALITDILDLSKIEAGKMELECIDFDLQLTVEEVMGMLGRKASQKKLELACHVDPHVPPLVRGDPDRLRQILINLLNNAIKFTETGAVIIRVTLDSESDSGVTVRFAVIDTGMGIPKERLDRLFKAFSQVDASTTRRFGGTGLGLAIAKELAALMGGEVGVESKVGEGSTFWFTAKLERQSAQAGVPRDCYADLAGLRVLAVTDSAPHRDILFRQLAGWNCQARTAANSDETLGLVRDAAAAGEPIEVAILDLDTPGMNGIELAEAVKQASGSNPIRLILLVPLENEADLSLLKAVGFAGSLNKPVLPSQLFDTLMSAVASGGARSLEAPDLSPAPSSRALSPSSGPFVPLRILVAEDNKVNQIVAAEILGRLGHACDIVDDGRKALNAVESGAYDLVLMDCQMPDLDGFEATRMIRQAEKEGRIASADGGPLPIIALTANAVKGDRELCLQAGMNSYLTKPIDQARLREAIKLVMTDRRAVVDSAPPVLSGDNVSGPGSARLAGAAGPPFDVEVLLERCMGNVTAVTQILDEFEKQASGDLERIERSLANADPTQAGKSAHNLKGAAGILSAQAVVADIALLENLARDGALNDAQMCLGELRMKVQRCVDYFPAGRQILASRSKPHAP